MPFVAAIELASNQLVVPAHEGTGCGNSSRVSQLLSAQGMGQFGELWQQQGKRRDAYDLLAPVYAWFTEGFDTANLRDTKALLQELNV